MDTERTIVVSGPPGSGKTALCAQLCLATGLPVSITPGGPDVPRQIDMLRLEQTLPDRPPLDAVADGPAIIEQSSYGPGFRGMADLHILIVDAVATLTSLKAGAPPGSRAFDNIDLLVISKGDIVDDSGVLEHVQGLTAAPVVSVHHGKLPADSLPSGNRRELGLPDNPIRQFWSYSGAADFSEQAADRFIVQRPAGIGRLKGRVMSGKFGLDLDVSGRARSITPCQRPSETILFATGDPSVFRESELAWHLAETASMDVSRRRMFSRR